MTTFWWKQQRIQQPYYCEQCLQWESGEWHANAEDKFMLEGIVPKVEGKVWRMGIQALLHPAQLYSLLALGPWFAAGFAVFVPARKLKEKFHLSDPVEESLLKLEGKHLSIKMGVFKTTSPTCCIQALDNKGHLPFSAGNLVNLFHQEENFVSSSGDIIPNLLKLHLGKIQHCFTPFYYTKCICVNLCPGIFSHTHIPLSV